MSSPRHISTSLQNARSMSNDELIKYREKINKELKEKRNYSLFLRIFNYSASSFLLVFAMRNIWKEGMHFTWKSAAKNTGIGLAGATWLFAAVNLDQEGKAVIESLDKEAKKVNGEYNARAFSQTP